MLASSGWRKSDPIRAVIRERRVRAWLGARECVYGAAGRVLGGAWYKDLMQVQAQRRAARPGRTAMIEMSFEEGRRVTPRRVDLARLTKLRDDADALGGQLSARVATKAERKLATAAVSGRHGGARH